MSAAIPFTPAVLAGAIADRADADQDECAKRAVERVEHSVSDAIRDTVVTTRSLSAANLSIPLTARLPLR